MDALEAILAQGQDDNASNGPAPARPTFTALPAPWANADWGSTTDDDEDIIMEDVVDVAATEDAPSVDGYETEEDPAEEDDEDDKTSSADTDSDSDTDSDEQSSEGEPAPRFVFEPSKLSDDSGSDVDDIPARAPPRPPTSAALNAPSKNLQRAEITVKNQDQRKCWNCHKEKKDCVGGDPTVSKSCNNCDSRHVGCRWNWDEDGPSPAANRLHNQERNVGDIRQPNKGRALTLQDIVESKATIPPCRRCFGNGNVCLDGDAATGKACRNCVRCEASCKWDLTGAKAHKNAIRRAKAARAPLPGKKRAGDRTRDGRVKIKRLKVADHLAHEEPCRRCHMRGHACHGGSRSKDQPCYVCTRAGKPFCNWDVTGANPHHNTTRRAERQQRAAAGTSTITHATSSAPSPSHDTALAYPTSPFRIQSDIPSHATSHTGLYGSKPISSVSKPIRPASMSGSSKVGSFSTPTMSGNKKAKFQPQDPLSKCRFCAQKAYRCNGDAKLNINCDTCSSRNKICNWDLSNTTFASGGVKGHSIEPEDMSTSAPALPPSVRQPRDRASEGTRQHKESGQVSPSKGTSHPFTSKNDMAGQVSHRRCKYCKEHDLTCHGGDPDQNRMCQLCVERGGTCAWERDSTRTTSHRVRPSLQHEETGTSATSTDLQPWEPRNGAQDPRTKCRWCAQWGYRCREGDPETNRGCRRCINERRPCNWDVSNTTFYRNKVRGRSIEPSEKRHSLPASLPSASARTPTSAPSPVPKPPRTSSMGPQDPLTKCRRCAQKCRRCDGGDAKTNKACNCCNRDGRDCNWDLTNTTFYSNHRNGRTISPEPADIVPSNNARNRSPAPARPEIVGLPSPTEGIQTPQLDPLGLRLTCRFCTQLGSDCSGPRPVDCDRCKHNKRKCNWDLTGVKYPKKVQKPNGVSPPKTETPLFPALTTGYQGKKRKHDVADDSDVGVNGTLSGDRYSAPTRQPSEPRALNADEIELDANEEDEDEDELAPRSRIVTLRVPAFKRHRSGQQLPDTAPVAGRATQPARGGPSGMSQGNGRLAAPALGSMNRNNLSLPSGTDLNMEDWEIAPGRIRASDSEKPENIAFSTSFLSSGNPIPVDNDVSFKIENILPGRVARFEPSPRGLRICSVSWGKVRVRIKDEPAFKIGRNGMFRIAPGKSCVVENVRYGEATLHVSCIQGR